MTWGPAFLPPSPPGSQRGRWAPHTEEVLRDAGPSTPGQLSAQLASL